MQRNSKQELLNMENIEEIAEPIIQALKNRGTKLTAQILENEKIAGEIVSHVQARYLGRSRNVLCLDEAAKTKITDKKLQEMVERYVDIKGNSIKLSSEIQSLPHKGNKQVDINTQKRISIKEDSIIEETVEIQRECFDIAKIETCQLRNRMSLKKYVEKTDGNDEIAQKSETTYRIIAMPEQGINFDGSTPLSTKPFMEYPRSEMSVEKVSIIRQPEGIKTLVNIKNTENAQEFSERRVNTKTKIENISIEEVKTAALKREYEKSQKVQGRSENKVIR